MSDSYQLYCAYKRAQAAWDMVLYSGEYEDKDVPDRINEPLEKAHSAALEAFLLHPVERPVELSRKMRIFRDEEIACGWHGWRAIVDVLAEDARRVLVASSCRPD